MTPEELATEIVRSVAELPDRTSPDDQPDMMLVTQHELREIVLLALSRAAEPPTAGVFTTTHPIAAPCDIQGCHYQKYLDALKRLRAASPPAREAREAWQPIETAPRDGTKFDAWQRDERVTDVFWSAIQEAWCVESDYPDEPTPLAIVPAITHWQPLPEPPRALKSSAATTAAGTNHPAASQSRP